MRRDAATPEAYREQVTGEQRVLLEIIREAIFDTVPEIEEVTEYGMLGYPGLANLAAQKHYVALYVKPSVLERHRDAFGGVSCGKSCLRFKRPEQADPQKLRALLAAVRAARAAEG